MIYLYGMIIVLNIFSFSLMGFDKHRAKSRGYRISERILLLIAAAGGSIGILTGMYFFHHKIRKYRFRFGIPLLILIQILIIDKALAMQG